MGNSGGSDGLETKVLNIFTNKPKPAPETLRKRIVMTADPQTCPTCTYCRHFNHKVKVQTKTVKAESVRNPLHLLQTSLRCPSDHV